MIAENRSPMSDDDEPPPSNHGEGGRFVRGNRASKGNPHAKAVNALRSVVLSRLTPEKMTAIVDKLISQATEGDLHAARELFDRALGRPAPAAPLGEDHDDVSAAPSRDELLAMLRSAGPRARDESGGISLQSTAIG